MNGNDHINFFNSKLQNMINFYKKYNFQDRILLPKEVKVFGVGDIHGDLKLALKMLVNCSAIEYNPDYFNDNIKPESFYHKLKDIKWIGGNRHIIQVGDQIDNCRAQIGTACGQKSANPIDEPSDLYILYLFTKLDMEAIQTGGRLISLLGNHEILNLLGVMDYVSYENIKMFGNTENRIKFFTHPKVKEFFALTRKPSIIVNQTLFSHAGVINSFMLFIQSDKFLKTKSHKNFIKHLNEHVKQYFLNKKSEEQEIVIESKILNYNESLFWNRVLGFIPSGLKYTDFRCNNKFELVLSQIQVDKMVIGHTPYLEEGISPTCGNKIIRIDIGASYAFSPWKKIGTNSVQVLEENGFEIYRRFMDKNGKKLKKLLK